ncbi:MAG: hypothetical protein F4Y91_07950 [Gemmatimonadetes bacterium]|nr:hypothetical protein [Gemmatimonadota bacterium]MXY81982.1 hypothetical protein [Gemmatimonadota bacterium]MYB69509.1 hypothetical protein [Gemmatimonadota bacterium]
MLHNPKNKQHLCARLATGLCAAYLSLLFIACSNESRVPNNSPLIAAKLAQGDAFPPCQLPIAASEDGAFINITCTLDNSWPTSAVHSQHSRGFHWGANNRTLVVVGSAEDDNIVQGSWDVELSLPGDGTIAAKSAPMVRVTDDDMETLAIEYHPQVVRVAQPAQATWYVDVYYKTPRIFLESQRVTFTLDGDRSIRTSTTGTAGVVFFYKSGPSASEVQLDSQSFDRATNGVHPLADWMNYLARGGYIQSVSVQGTDYSNIEAGLLHYEHDIPAQTSVAVEGGLEHGEIVVKGNREVAGGVVLGVTITSSLHAGNPAFDLNGAAQNAWAEKLEGPGAIARLPLKRSNGTGISDAPYSCGGAGRVEVLIERSNNPLFDYIKIHESVEGAVNGADERTASFAICP